MQPLFGSMLLGGFECSTLTLGDGRRVDVVAASQHDLRADEDYGLLRELGILGARDGFRWHLVEQVPGVYDFSSAVLQVRAARRAGVTVIWDLCHYGWPDHLSIWSPAFPHAFAAFAKAAALFLRDQGIAAPFWCPVNEISYWAWAGGQVQHIGPYAWGQGPALKRQLVRAANLAIDAVRRVDPACRIVLVDPLIHVVPDRPRDQLAADRTRLWMYEAWDLIGGRLEPALGGDPGHLDIIGVNFYSNNQRLLSGPEITPDHPGWKPFRYMLLEAWQRYRRPILVAETGAEGEAGAGWLADVCAEVRAAMELGVAIAGVCIYPVMDYPGWVDARHCPCGPIQAAHGFGPRRFYPPMAAAVLREEAAFAAFARVLAAEGPRSG